MTRHSRKWLMLAVAVIWSYVTFQDGLARGWGHPSVWARACLAAVFFLQATFDPAEQRGIRTLLRQPKGILLAGLLVASVVLMVAGRR